MNPPPISPMTLLILLTTLTAAAVIVSLVARQLERRRLAALARSWNMHYSPHDVFHLGERVAPHLPEPGAAIVRVRDCIYGNETGGHRYVFRAEYTTGATRSKRRHWCVATVLEPRRREDPITWQSLKIAEAGKPVIEQYQSLKTQAV